MIGVTKDSSARRKPFFEFSNQLALEFFDVEEIDEIKGVQFELEGNPNIRFSFMANELWVDKITDAINHAIASGFLFYPIPDYPI